MIFYNQTSVDTYDYLTDFLYRFTETIRSILRAVEYIDYSVCQRQKSDNTVFLMYKAIIMLYSTYEKLGKFMYVLFEVNNYERGKDKLKNIYFETVVKDATKDNEVNSLQPFKYAQKLIVSSDYKKFLRSRNKIFHGIRPHILLSKEDLFFWTTDMMDNVEKNIYMIFNLYDLSLNYLNILGETIIKNYNN